MTSRNNTPRDNFKVLIFSCNEVYEAVKVVMDEFMYRDVLICKVMAYIQYTAQT